MVFHQNVMIEFDLLNYQPLTFVVQGYKYAGPNE